MTSLPQVIECVPNFSVGRDERVLNAIIEACTSVDGVFLLDRHSDPDHNRSVLTLAGAPMAMQESIFRGIRSASRLIDLDHHRGTHPRLGASDVVPFIPIHNIDMAQCVNLARQLGQRVGSELGLPVYLYAEAALLPSRCNLADVRRGGYELLKQELGRNPARNPDFGPLELTHAGAVTIGARQALVALNIYLASEDLSVARHVARAVRASSGGLPGVKALGMMVNGMAQVSMNLTDPLQSPVSTVIDMVSREAARWGAPIHHCELVGLAPEAVLLELAAARLDPAIRGGEKALEHQLRKFGLIDGSETIDACLEALSSSAPTPGGGFAGALAAAQAAALVQKVGRVMLRKKECAAGEAISGAIGRAQSLQIEMKRLAYADSEAFRQFNQAMAEQKKRPDESTRTTLRAAAAEAVSIPLRAASCSLEIMRLSLELAVYASPALMADLAAATHLAHAALLAARHNIQANRSWADMDINQTADREMTALSAQSTEVFNAMSRILQAAGL